MKLRRLFLLPFLLWATASFTQTAGYPTLVQIFEELGTLRQPPLARSWMDYSAAGREQRQKKLHELRFKFDKLNSEGWPIAQRVDYLLVRSQLDDLDFEYRVLRPWARDPGLYVDMVRPLAYTRLPVSAEQLPQFKARLAAVPAVLELAKTNLTDGAAELAKLALLNLEFSDGVNHEQPYREHPPQGVLGWFADLAERAASEQTQVLSEARTATAALQDFHAWLKQNLSRMTAPSGVGAQNYDWYLHHVHFEPFTTMDVLRIGDRELSRSRAGLELERVRNRDLPVLQPAASAAEYQRRVMEADRHVRDFIRRTAFLTIPSYANDPFDNNVSWMARATGRNFWEEVQFRDPLPDKVHAGIPGHRFDLFVHEHDQRPIRRGIEDGSRIEGWGFYLEEAMMNAGLLDQRPRTRELFWIFMIARAVRNRAEVMLHTNQWSVEQAVQYMVEQVPYMNADVARVDCEIYLRNPTYGQNYQMGKIQIEDLLASRARQLADKFNLGQFHDRFLASGTIPVALIAWEMTGDDTEVKQLLNEP